MKLVIPVTSGGKSAPFSPLDAMIAINAASIAGAGPAEVFANFPANLTEGVGFMVTEAGHSCSGVRGVWAGPATTVRVRLWALTHTGGVSQATVDVAVASGLVTAQVYTGTFGAAFTLVPGVIYTVTAWDTAGLHTTAMGTATNSPTNQLFGNLKSFPAAGWLTYCLPAPNGGGGDTSPFALQQNAPDAYPTNISTASYSPIEPVLV